MKTFLGVRRFHDDEVKEAVNTWLHRRLHHYTMQGYKKIVPPDTTSASTAVESMSKSSVRYAHQMAI
jgi:hypothetical protein